MIEATKIRIERWEGTVDECEPVEVEGPEVWKQVNALLHRMSHTAPKGGACDKTGFKVTYADGHEYEGRYELRGDEMPNLQNHMRSYCMFHAGQWCPPHMTEKRYQAYLSDIVKPEARKAYQEMLEKYEIGPQPKAPDSAQGRWLEAMGAL